MTLIRRSGGLVPGLSRVFDDFFKDDFFRLPATTNDGLNTMPSVNVKETEDAFEMEVAVPGMNKDDFNINIDDNVLTISSEKKEENEVNEENYHKREFRYHTFKRTFTIPATVKSEEINAKYEDGILHLTLPKREEAKSKPSRVIGIS